MSTWCIGLRVHAPLERIAMYRTENVVALTKEYVELGQRLSCYLGMLEAGIKLLELSAHLESEKLFNQAQVIFDKIQEEDRARPIFFTLNEKDLN